MALKKALRRLTDIPHGQWTIRLTVDAVHPAYLSFAATYRGLSVVLSRQLVIDPFDEAAQESDDYRLFMSDMMLPGHDYEAQMFREAYNTLAAELHIEVDAFVREERRKWREEHADEEVPVAAE